MVVSRNGGGSELGERVSGGVEQLGDVLAGVVAERVGVDLATHDKDRAIGEDDAVGESALVVHVPDGLGGGLAGGVADCDDVGVRGGIDVLVGGGAADGKDLAVDGVVHGCVAAHGVAVAGAGASAGLGARAGGAVPVHGFGGAGLEHVTVLPAEEPAVIVGAIDT